MLRGTVQVWVSTVISEYQETSKMSVSYMKPLETKSLIQRRRQL